MIAPSLIKFINNLEAYSFNSVDASVYFIEGNTLQKC